MGVLQNNGFGRRGTSGDAQSSYLWFRTAMLNHRCSGNCSTLNVGSYMFIRNVLEVQRGEQLTWNYLRGLDPPMLWDSLRLNWGFECTFQCDERCTAIKNSS